MKGFMDPVVTPKKTTWDRIGHVFALVAHGAGRLARWASAHPEVLKIVEGVAVAKGASPSVVAAIETGVRAAGAVDEAVDR